MTFIGPMYIDPGPCPYAAPTMHMMGWDFMRRSFMGMDGSDSPFKEDRKDGLYKLSLEWKQWIEGQEACCKRIGELNGPVL